MLLARRGAKLGNQMTSVFFFWRFFKVVKRQIAAHVLVLLTAGTLFG